MNRVIAFLKKEHTYLQALSGDQQRLLISTFLFGLAQPMIQVFSNTYLWRQSGDAVVLALFGIGHYVGLAFGFLLNGFFLKHVRLSFLFFAGCLLQGAVPVLLVFLGARSEQFVFPLGLSLGLAAGFYWGNRNLLTSVLTVGAARFKYISLEMVLNLASSVIAPAAIGWFLVFGERAEWYGMDVAYRIAAVFGFILLSGSGLCAAGIQRSFDTIDQLFVGKASAEWNRMRVLDYANGLTDGLERIIPLLIVLLFLGQEDSVGFMQSTAAVLSMIGMYLSGKWVSQKDYARIVGTWTVVTAAAKSVFALTYSVAGAVTFILANGLVMSFRWASLAAVMYDAIDREPGDGFSKRYRYLMDREFFLNAGRVTGLLIFIGLYLVSPELTVRYGLLLAVLSQIGMVAGVRRLTRVVVPTS